LEHTHFVGERGLVTDGGRRAAEQRGHLGAGLRETENVVDEEQHVLVFLVAEILSHRERGEGDAHTGARRLVHLAVHERDLGLGEVVLVDDACVGHLMVEIVALTGALADTGEHGVAAVGLGDVVDEFENDDGLANAGTAEGASLAAAEERADEVDDLDAGLEDLRLGVLLDERGRRAVDRVLLLEFDGAFAVHGVAGDVEDATKDAIADWDGNRGAGIDDLHAAHEALGGGHGDGASDAATEVLLDLKGERFLFAGDGEFDGQRLVDRGDGALGELYVHHGADHLENFTGVHWRY